MSVQKNILASEHTGTRSFNSFPASTGLAGRNHLMGSSCRGSLVKKMYQPRNPLLPGEKTIKQWKLEVAEKLGVTLDTIEHRLWRGSMEYPRCRRVNRRVVIVLPS